VIHEMRNTIISPWTSEWAKQYQKEECILKEIFQNELIEIHHIGSTSIPTIGYAKPIIDIMIVVKDIELIDGYNDEMKNLDYVPRGENRIKGRRYFTKGNKQRTHHVHIYQVGNVNSKIHLDFKEYLMHHTEEAEQYGELKRKLANQFPNDHYKYQSGKESFVNVLVEKVMIWGSSTKK